MAFQWIAEGKASKRIPKTHGIVHAACCYCGAVGRPADNKDPAGVALESM